MQADLRAFDRLKVHGACVVTCLTAQNRNTVARLEPCSPRMVRAQLDAVDAAFPLSSAKTGMLYSAAIVREVAAFFQQARFVPLVVDPVIISTSGRRLLQKTGLAMLQRRSAAAVPPGHAQRGRGGNADRNKNNRHLENLRAAARNIRRVYAVRRAGQRRGTLAGTDEAVDFLCSAQGEVDAFGSARQSKGPALEPGMHLLRRHRGRAGARMFVGAGGQTGQRPHHAGDFRLNVICHPSFDGLCGSGAGHKNLTNV